MVKMKYTYREENMKHTYGEYAKNNMYVHSSNIIIANAIGK